jgi:hypothetical protein
MTPALGYVYNPDRLPDASKSVGADTPGRGRVLSFPGSTTQQYPTTIEE